MREAVRALRDKEFTALVLAWLDKAGPFWDADRYPNDDDYFHFEGTDVTDQGLGEAARRLIASVDAHAFSFLDEAETFARTPLTVEHGLPEEPLGTLEVANWWNLAALEEAATPRPATWKEALGAANSRFGELIFSQRLLETLQSSPFDRALADRIFELLTILQSIAEETKDDSSLTAKGMELEQQFFVGGRALFTDESRTNKSTFERQLTFPDPTDEGRQLFCPWHGKIRMGVQFRIHFEWKRPSGQRKIKIVYIGPKITRD